MNQNYDVIIIGGGIIGSSVACHLANENLKIIVVNSTRLGTPATIASAGLISPSHSATTSPLLKDFCFKSSEYFSSFYNFVKSDFGKSEINLGYNQPGSLHLIFSNFEVAEEETKIKELKVYSPNISFLNKQNVLKYEPKLTKDILGAYYYPNEGYINIPKFLKAISTYCLKRNIEFKNNEVKEINTTKGAVENIVLDNGETISGGKYILTNGVWGNRFLQKILNTKESLIKAIKGEILAIETPDELPLQKIIFCSEGYILPRPKTNTHEKQSIIVGSTMEEVNIEENKNLFSNSIMGLSLLTNLFGKLFSECKDYKVLNHWAGLRPKTQDNLPIIDKSEDIKNLYFGLGHYRHGILTGPLSGKILSNLILEKTPEYNIDIFKLERLTRPNIRQELVIRR